MVVPCCPQWSAGRESRRGPSCRRQERASVSEAWFAAVDDRIDSREATRLLAELPLEQREVVVARIGGGLTFEEVAQLAGCSLPTAPPFPGRTGPLYERGSKAHGLKDPTPRRRPERLRASPGGLATGLGRPECRRHALRCGTSCRPAWAEPTALADVVCALRLCKPRGWACGAYRGPRPAPNPGQPSSLLCPDTNPPPRRLLPWFESPQRPSPGDYLSTRRQMEQDPNGWLASRQPAGLQALGPSPPPPAILTPRQRDGLFDL